MNENATENGLTPKQRKALEAFAMGKSPAAAAQEAGVNRTTVYRWQRDPVFVAELRRLGTEALERTARRLTAMSEAAVLTLLDGMTRENPIGARLRAAGLVLENAQRWVELVDIVARLEEIEREVRGEQK